MIIVGVRLCSTIVRKRYGVFECKQVVFLLRLVNLSLFGQFKPSSSLQESTIGEIGKEYMIKTIDENNRKPTGNNAIQIGAGNTAPTTSALGYDRITTNCI